MSREEGEALRQWEDRDEAEGQMRFAKPGHSCRICWREGAPVKRGLCPSCVTRALAQVRAGAERKREQETATMRLSESFKAQLRLASMRGDR